MHICMLLKFSSRTLNIILSHRQHITGNSRQILDGLGFCSQKIYTAKLLPSFIINNIKITSVLSKCSDKAHNS